MDINAIWHGGNDPERLKTIRENASLNLKRVFSYDKDWMDTESQDLYLIADFQEVKTTWHPVEKIGGVAGSY
jgi:hypothetical protein